MKTISMDYDEYQNDLRESEVRGYRKGLQRALSFAHELLKGTPTKDMDIEDDLEYAFVDFLKEAINQQVDRKPSRSKR